MEDRIATYERLAYWFLARPDEASMQGMVTIATSDEAAPWSRHFSSFGGRIRAVGPQAALQELAVDRTRLFKGLTPDGPTPPYQSLFKKDDRSDTLARLNRTYREAGFSMPDVRDAPDQLGVELTFMAFLLRRASRAPGAACSAEGGGDMQVAARFFQGELRPFALTFCTVMEGEAQTDFFRGFALLLETFIGEEGESLS